LPTVAFAVGGVPDAIEDGVSGDLVRPDDYLMFARKVVDWLRRRPDSSVRSRARTFAERFRWESIGAQMRQVVLDTGAEVHSKKKSG
jgi:phosphatidylinositol alpha-1,6-mannosyltransferase